MSFVEGENKKEENSSSLFGSSNWDRTSDLKSMNLAL